MSPALYAAVGVVLVLIVWVWAWRRYSFVKGTDIGHAVLDFLRALMGG